MVAISYSIKTSLRLFLVSKSIYRIFHVNTKQEECNSQSWGVKFSFLNFKIDPAETQDIGSLVRKIFIGALM